jgi:hypothetical protein
MKILKFPVLIFVLFILLYQTTLAHIIVDIDEFNFPRISKKGIRVVQFDTTEQKLLYPKRIKVPISVIENHH